MALEYLTWWFISPGVACFLLLNVLVAAVAFTSRPCRAQQGEGGRAASTTRRRLCRSASSMVLDRLGSFAIHPSVEFCYYISRPDPVAEELKQVNRAAPDDRQFPVPEPATMAAAISMSGNAEDETAAGVGKSVVSSDGNWTCALGQEGRHGHAHESMLSPPPPPAAPAVAVVTAETVRMAPALVRGPPKEEEEPAMVAEFVERKHCRRDHVYAVEGKAELNSRAEQFIRQFRQELKLQRLHSLLGRHTHTFSTGSGAPTSRR